MREVKLRPVLDRPSAVTNSRFAEFVDATGYVTDAERFGWSFVFGGLLPDDFPDTRGVAERAVVAPGVRGRLAPARRPAVRRSRTAPTTPSCTCRGTTRGLLRVGRHRGCPTEAEWEYAARGGLEQKRSRGATS